MICLAVGLGILGYAAMRCAHRGYHGHHCHGWSGRHGDGWSGPNGDGGRHGWHGRHPFRRRMMMHALFSRIDASPAQARAIVAEVEKLEERVRAAKASVKGARGDLAAALRGPVLDDAALGAVLGRVDAATAEARAAVIDALRAIHALLDDKQRAQLADLLDNQAGGWWGAGPYR